MCVLKNDSAALVDRIANPHAMGAVTVTAILIELLGIVVI